jgi:hypothetical protein
MDKIRQLGGLGVDRIHVIPGPLEPGRTLAAVRDMLRDVQQVPT